MVAGLIVAVIGIEAWHGLFPEGATHWSPLGTGIAFAIFAVALALLVIGAVTIARGDAGGANKKMRTSTQTAEALIRRIEKMERPFYVCTGCHLVFSTSECFGVCPQCAREVDCLRVEDDADLQTVIAAVSPPPDD
jgi:hypothetical protein